LVNDFRSTCPDEENSESGSIKKQALCWNIILMENQRYDKFLRKVTNFDSKIFAFSLLLRFVTITSLLIWILICDSKNYLQISFYLMLWATHVPMALMFVEVTQIFVFVTLCGIPIAIHAALKQIFFKEKD
jgi:hypothetical protein